MCSQEAFDLSLLTVKSLSAPCRQYNTPTFSTRNPVKLDFCNINFQMEQFIEPLNGLGKMACIAVQNCAKLLKKIKILSYIIYEPYMI